MPFAWFLIVGVLSGTSWAAEAELPTFLGVQAADSSFPFKLLCDQTFSISDGVRTCNVGLFSCDELKPNTEGNVLFQVQNVDGTLRSYDFDADMKRKIQALYQGIKNVETATEPPTGDHELGKPVCNLADEAETGALGGSCSGPSSYLGFKCFGGGKDNLDYICYDLQPAEQDMAYFRGLYVQAVKEFYKQVKQEIGAGLNGIPTLTLKTPACQEFARNLEAQYKKAIDVLRSTVSGSEGLNQNYCQSPKPKNEVLSYVANPQLWRNVEDTELAEKHRLDPPDIRAAHMLALSHEFAALYFDLVACEAEGRARQYFTFHMAENGSFLNTLYGFEALTCRNQVHEDVGGHDDHSMEYLGGRANRCWIGETDPRFGFKAMIKNVYYDYFFNITQQLQGQRPEIYDQHTRGYRKGGRSCHLDLDWDAELFENNYPDIPMYFQRYTLRDQTTYPWILPWLRESFGADEWEFRASHPSEREDDDMVIREYSTYFPGAGTTGAGCRDMMGILMTGPYKDRCCKDGVFLSQSGCPNYLDQTMSSNIDQWIKHLNLATDSLEQLREASDGQLSSSVKIGGAPLLPTVQVSSVPLGSEIPKNVEFSGSPDTGSVSLAVAGVTARQRNAREVKEKNGTAAFSSSGKTNSGLSRSNSGDSIRGSGTGDGDLNAHSASSAVAENTEAPPEYVAGQGGGLSGGSGFESEQSGLDGTQLTVFGAEAPEEVDPMHGEDPENYFERTKKGSSLFKNVEKVYRKKTIDWKRSDLKRFK